jgi:hypothetical protein
MIEAGEEEIATRRQHGCRVYAADIWRAMVAAGPFDIKQAEACE